jgi:putative hemolysin
MLALARVAQPMVFLLSAATAGVLTLLRIDTRGGPSVTEEEITASLDQGVDAGLIELHEHQMVKNVFHLDERSLTSMMVPRADIEWLDARTTVDQALALVGQWGAHSWYPVCRDGLDHVLGAVNVGQLLDPALDRQTLMETLAQPVPFVPETLSGLDLLSQFRRPAAVDASSPQWRDHSRGRLTLVVDEYGVVQGMLTPRDVLEAIGAPHEGGENDEPIYPPQFRTPADAPLPPLDLAVNWRLRVPDGEMFRDLFRALGRYNGSLGQPDYPNAVVGAWMKNWKYQPRLASR